MAFHDKTEEDQYLNQRWSENITLTRIFAALIFLHSVYLTFIYYIYNVTFTVTVSILIYGIYIPISIIVLFLSFMQPLRHKWSRRLWYTAISIASIMVGTGIAVRTLFCRYGIEDPTHCTFEARPISNAEYAIIYVLMGPLLILNIFRNNLQYQIVAIIVMLAIVIWSLIVSREYELLLWFSLVFIVGAQFMAVMVERGRIVLERAKFISEINNKKLTKYLSQEIAEKTKAQEKAKDEEDKRTQFTNMLFHEMRVPLNSVILSLNDLEADDSLKGNIGDDAVENMERINSGLNAIINIINDSLDLRKMTQGKL